MTLNLADYFSTVFEDKLLVKLPERDDDQITGATRMLEKRREMKEVEQALGAQKEEFLMKMESLQQRRDELQRKEFQLQEALLKFDKFLKENDTKKARAFKKTSEEKHINTVKDRELIHLKRNAELVTKQRDKLSSLLGKYNRFQKYLEKALEKGDQFQEIREVIGRHDTLVALYSDLINDEVKNQEQIEKTWINISRYTETKNNEILLYNNDLARLQTQLEVARSNAVKWEHTWQKIQSTAATRTLLLGRTKMASYNLFQLVNKHTKTTVTSVADDDTSSQLDRIKTFVVDLTKITQEIKDSEQKNHGDSDSGEVELS